MEKLIETTQDCRPGCGRGSGPVEGSPRQTPRGTGQGGRGPGQSPRRLAGRSALPGARADARRARPGQDADGPDHRPDARPELPPHPVHPRLDARRHHGHRHHRGRSADGPAEAEFLQGPLFTNFLLADEINRAPPKTQSALLQAMQELEVSVGRQTYKLPPPFFVVATQNPIEQEGTYPLPEAQLDRFMFNIPVTYPTPEEEAAIVTSTTTNQQARSSRCSRPPRSCNCKSWSAACRSPIRSCNMRSIWWARRGRAISRAQQGRRPQVHPLRRQPPCDAILDSRRQGPGRPQRAIPRRFRRRPRRGRSRAAAPAGVDVPRPGRKRRCRRAGGAAAAKRARKSRSV